MEVQETRQGLWPVGAAAARNGTDNLARGYLELMRSENVEARHRRLQQVRALVAAGLAPLEALVPCWQVESEPSIVASAALEYLMLRPVATTGSMSGVRELLTCVQGREAANPGALLAGVVLTGDQRAIDLVLAEHPELDRNLARDACSTQSGVLLGPAIALYMQWMERAIAASDIEVMRDIARGMTGLLRSTSGKEVIFLERAFGAAAHLRGVRVIGRTPFDIYQREIANKVSRWRVPQAVERDFLDLQAAWRGTRTIH